MAEYCCERPDCSMPGTTCPACEQCFCWQHLRESSCETCRNLVSHRSFEYQLGRLVSIGLIVFLLGIFFFLLPHDVGGIMIHLSILLVLCGFLLFWLGLVART